MGVYETKVKYQGFPEELNATDDWFTTVGLNGTFITDPDSSKSLCGYKLYTVLRADLLFLK